MELLLGSQATEVPFDRHDPRNHRRSASPESETTCLTRANLSGALLTRKNRGFRDCGERSLSKLFPTCSEQPAGHQ